MGFFWGSLLFLSFFLSFFLGSLFSDKNDKNDKNEAPIFSFPTTKSMTREEEEEEEDFSSHV